jgi:TolB-like protein
MMETPGLHFSGASVRLRSSVLFHGLFLLNLFATGASSQTKTNIAVSDLIGRGVDQESAAIVSDRLRTNLFKAGTFNVLERQSMQDILKEQGFQHAGCTSDQCLVEIGQVLGVSQIVAGTVGKLGSMYTLDIRIIDVRTAQIIYTTSVDCRCSIEDVLTKSVPSIAEKIAASTGKTGAVASKAPPEAPSPAAGSLRVRTVPPGARIFVDKVDNGVTPYSKDTLDAGSHSLAIQLDGYIGLDTVISVSSGEQVADTFNLSHTKAWKDSVESARRTAAEAAKPAPVKTVAVKNAGEPHKKHSVAPKIVFGLLAAGSAAAGVVFNSMEQDRINHDADLKKQYANSGYSNTSDYQTQLGSNTTQARNYDTMRNVFYIAAGVCAAGFLISFAF